MSAKENRLEQLILDIDFVESKIVGLMEALRESEDKRFDLERQVIQLRKENELYRLKYEQVLKEGVSSGSDIAKNNATQNAEREKTKAKLGDVISRLDNLAKGQI